MIGDIEGFGAELEPSCFMDWEGSLNCHIGLHCSKGAKEVARRAASAQRVLRDAEDTWINLLTTWDTWLVYVGILAVVVKLSRDLIARYRIDN